MELIHVFCQLVLPALHEKYNRMRNNGKMLVLARLDGDKKMDDHVNTSEAIRIGAPTCDVIAHLEKYDNVPGIDVWNSDPKHVIDVITDFSKPDIED